jgi:anti-sigma factor ChrR (cupin superfamily)
MELTAIPWRSTQYAGIQIHFYGIRKASGRTLALIRMAPGCGYPRHHHYGPEELLVVQGGYRDEMGSYRAGQWVSYPEGSSHSPIALDGDHGQDCILLALAHEGIVRAPAEGAAEMSGC